MRLAAIIYLAWSAALCWPERAFGAEGLVLAPHLTDNMVVRRSTKFYGLAPGKERVRIQIKGKGRPFVARADASGAWEREMSFAASAEPMEIEFYLGENKEPERVLTNVVAGEILIAGIAFGQGIPAKTNRATAALRFVRLESLEAKEHGPGAPRWRVADADGLAAADFDLLAFEQALTLARNGAPAGVIFVPEAMFAACARMGEGAFPLEFEERLKSANKDTDAAIRERANKVRMNKRMGRIESVPPVNNYERHLLYAPSQFRAKTEIPERLDFGAALGPQETRR